MLQLTALHQSSAAVKILLLLESATCKTVHTAVTYWKQTQLSHKTKCKYLNLNLSKNYFLCIFTPSLCFRFSYAVFTSSVLSIYSLYFIVCHFNMSSIHY